MTQRPFAPGIVDLSTLAPKPPAPAGSGYVLDNVTEEMLDDVLRRSLQHVVVMELFSPRANAESLSQTLRQLANAAGGRYLLTRVDVDAQPRIAQALQVQAVPTVVGLIQGQIVPLWQGTKDAAEAEAIIEQLMQVAAQNGIVGHADPVPAQGDAEEPQGADPRFAAADEALDRGDYAGARAEFEKLLAQNPADAEASAGRAQAGLLERLQGIDPEATLAAAAQQPGDVDAQLAAADVELAIGNPEAGFARLVEVVRQTSGADRDRVRARLLELFETLGNADPAVNKARRDLMSALF